ncbi:hypothetical protein ACC763_39495, partial [Rhizobium ruizarguesonis]
IKMNSEGQGEQAHRKSSAEGKSSVICIPCPLSFSIRIVARNIASKSLRIAFPGEEAFGRKHANARSSEHQPVPGAGYGYLVMKSDGTV